MKIHLFIFVGFSLFGGQHFAATIPQKVEAARGNMKLSREATEEKTSKAIFKRTHFFGGVVENKQGLLNM